MHTNGHETLRENFGGQTQSVQHQEAGTFLKQTVKIVGKIPTDSERTKRATDTFVDGPIVRL